MVKRALIVFATREGQTEKVASTVASHLEKRGVSVQLANAGEPEATASIDLEACDLLVFGGSLHAGGLEKELISYIDRHHEQIAGKPRSFFLVLLSAATKDPKLKTQWLADAKSKLDGQLPLQFEEPQFIAGALKYSKYPLPLKWLMRRIARQAGAATDTSQDYEYTDWQQVERYANQLADVIAESRRAGQVL